MNFLFYEVLGLFLYFPEDKTEYIPAVITGIIFFIAAILTMRLIINHSKKEEAKLKEFERKVLEEQTKSK
ncbi:hypothetical protein [Bacillus massilioanorexius]|uniref:hypothetical protein n=1 Tax=Bacillus TaxID=1386 RepID=UPI0002F60B25